MEKGIDTFLFYLGHPAHYHNISMVIKQLSHKGFRVVLVARGKDVLFDLLEGLPYEIIYLKVVYYISHAEKRDVIYQSQIIQIKKVQVQIMINPATLPSKKMKIYLIQCAKISIFLMTQILSNLI